MPVQNNNVLIIGLGLSGRAAAHFLLNQGMRPKGVDRRWKELLSFEEIVSLKNRGMEIGSDSIEEVDLSSFAFVVVSPGVPPAHPIVQQAVKIGLEVFGEIELGCRHGRHSIVGITGTNGKTTVTLLVAHILNESGFRAHPLGNVGIPFTQQILTIPPEEWIILELSSFQLETLKQKVLDVAAILNITPDHLDRYPSMEAYAKAKCLIQYCLKPNKKLLVEDQVFANYHPFLKLDSLISYGYLSKNQIHTDLKGVYFRGRFEIELPVELQGKKSHDLENFLAAYGICREVGVMADQFVSAYETFKKPSHRIEFVLEHQGIRYYDDSKGTNLDAVVRAVESIDRPIVLIAGGVHKGAPYTPWLKGFRGRVKKVFAIGEAAEKIKEDLCIEIPVEIITNLEQAVLRAASASDSGDAVLLSPGCSSFDMFRDYAHRGNVFQAAVRRIKGEQEG